MINVYRPTLYSHYLRKAILISIEIPCGQITLLRQPLNCHCIKYTICFKEFGILWLTMRSAYFFSTYKRLVVAFLVAEMLKFILLLYSLL